RRVRPGRHLVQRPAGGCLVAVAPRRRPGGAGVDRHDPREPVASRSAPATSGTDGLPGETNTLARSKKRHLSSIPTLTPTRVVRPVARAPSGEPASRNNEGSFTRSVPLSARSIPNAWVSRAGPEHRSRTESVPRFDAIVSNPSSGSAARSRTALPYPSGPVTTLQQKCCP